MHIKVLNNDMHQREIFSTALFNITKIHKYSKAFLFILTTYRLASKNVCLKALNYFSS